MLRQLRTDLRLFIRFDWIDKINKQITLSKGEDVIPILKTSKSESYLRSCSFYSKTNCIQVIHSDALVKVFLVHPAINRSKKTNNWYVSNVIISALC